MLCNASLSRTTQTNTQVRHLLSRNAKKRNKIAKFLKGNLEVSDRRLHCNGFLHLPPPHCACAGEEEEEEDVVTRSCSIHPTVPTDYEHQGQQELPGSGVIGKRDLLLLPDLTSCGPRAKSSWSPALFLRGATFFLPLEARMFLGRLRISSIRRKKKN